MNQKEALSLIYGGEKCYPSYTTVAPCEGACPIGMKVPDYVTAIGKGQFDEAYQVMLNSTPFIALCGYVCHHPCETACSRGKLDGPIAIRGLKRFVVDTMMDRGLKTPQNFQRRRPEQVAVIGSGPAGLSAAYYLTRSGYGVTIFEAQSSAGGMLRMGIPEFALPRNVIDAQVGIIESLGVEFKLGVALGKDISIEDLMSQNYGAVFLGLGAQGSGKLNIPGIEAEGVKLALPLIQDVNMGKRVEMGQKVVVIGGGNVAVQAARVAVRMGAGEVHVVCLEGRDRMPAFKWEIEEAEEEGIQINNSLAPIEVVTEGNRVAGVRFGTVEKFELDDLGRVSFKVSEAAPTLFETDTVLVAVGQAVVPDALEGLNLADRGTVAIDPETFATNLSGVFAGGDAVTVPGTVVGALSAGKQAALSMDRYLKGMPLISKKDAVVMEIQDEQLPQFVEKRDRVTAPHLSVPDRIKSFDPVEMSLSQADAVSEAKRCLNCSMCGHCLFEQSRCCYQTGLRLL